MPPPNTALQGTTNKPWSGARNAFQLRKKRALLPPPKPDWHLYLTIRHATNYVI